MIIGWANVTLSVIAEIKWFSSQPRLTQEENRQTKQTIVDSVRTARNITFLNCGKNPLWGKGLLVYCYILINQLTNTRYVPIALPVIFIFTVFNLPILRVAMFFFHTISSRHRIFVSLNKGYHHNIPVLPSQTRNDVRTISLPSKVNDNWIVQAT